MDGDLILYAPYEDARLTIIRCQISESYVVYLDLIWKGIVDVLQFPSERAALAAVIALVESWHGEPLVYDSDSRDLFYKYDYADADHSYSDEEADIIDAAVYASEIPPCF